MMRLLDEVALDLLENGIYVGVHQRSSVERDVLRRLVEDDTR